jgi:peptidoglycan/LPS O-acetylase OafA/YrhL
LGGFMFEFLRNGRMNLRPASPQTFAYSAVIALTAFAILPAWRPQLFGADYSFYYCLRAGAFLVLAAMFVVFSRELSVNLSVESQATTKTGYGDPLLSLRAFACAVVLIGHGASITFAPSDLIRQASESRTFWLLLPLPWAGVWIFFTLSGYLMGKGFFTGRYQFSRDGIIRFYNNRLLRLVPLAYFSIAVAVLFMHPEATATPNIKHLIALLLFDYDGTAPLSLIGLLWSIATEMQFYLLAPFMAFAVYMAAQRMNILFVAAALAVLGTAYRIGCLIFAGPSSWTVAVYTPLLGNLDIFGIGMITSFVVQRYPIKWARMDYGLGLMAVLYIVSAVCCSRVIASSPHWAGFMQFCAPPLFALTTACIILLFENAIGTANKASSITIAAIASTQLFGTLTYAVYLWHAPIFQIYATTLTKPVFSNQTMQALAVASILVFGFSWVTYRLIEKPFDDLKSRNSDHIVASVEGIVPIISSTRTGTTRR